MNLNTSEFDRWECEFVPVTSSSKDSLTRWVAVMRRRGAKRKDSLEEQERRKMRVLQLLEFLKSTNIRSYAMFPGEVGFTAGIHQLSFLSAVLVIVAMGLEYGDYALEFG
jgi:hypothetical protein